MWLEIFGTYIPQATIRLTSVTLRSKRLPRRFGCGGARRTLRNPAYAPPREVHRDFSPLRKAKRPLRGVFNLAERGGFEPPIGYEPIHAFQACDLNHSSTSPEFVPDACDRTKPAIIAKLGHCRLSTNRDKKKPLHLSVKRQSGNRAIGVSPTTFPHKLALLLKLNHRQPMAACRGVLLYLPCFSWPASADPGWPGFPASTHLA